MPTVKLTYLLSILSAEEAIKPVSKCLQISASLELGADEPWDRIKAQLLVKIDEALAPWVLKFDDYLTMFFIPCVLPKPGMVLSTDENYAALLLCAKNLTYSSQTSPLLKQKPLCCLPFAKGKTGGGHFLKICFHKAVAAFFKPF